jgi:hypothetical protein
VISGLRAVLIGVSLFQHSVEGDNDGRTPNSAEIGAWVYRFRRRWGGRVRKVWETENNGMFFSASPCLSLYPLVGWLRGRECQPRDELPVVYFSIMVRHSLLRYPSITARILNVKTLRFNTIYFGFPLVS